MRIRRSAVQEGESGFYCAICAYLRLFFSPNALLSFSQMCPRRRAGVGWGAPKKLDGSSIITRVTKIAGDMLVIGNVSMTMTMTTRKGKPYYCLLFART